MPNFPSRRAVLAGAASLTVVGPSPVAVASSARAGGEVIAERRLDERLVELTIDSPALGSTIPVALLTPHGWDRRGRGDRWPTLYLLAGGDGDHTTWTTMFRVQELTELHDVLVVMPAMPLFGFWTDWWNNGQGGTPRVRTYFLKEVVPLMERHYGAGPRRAAGGESQGGFGALGMAARNPGLFRAIAAFSAPVHPIQHPEMWLSGAAYLGVDGYKIWGDPWKQWEVWLDWDPFYRAKGLRDTPLYLASGDGTPGPLDGDADVHIPGTEKWIALFPDDVVSVTEAAGGFETRTLTHRLRSLGAPRHHTHLPRHPQRHLRIPRTTPRTTDTPRCPAPLTQPGETRPILRTPGTYLARAGFPGQLRVAPCRASRRVMRVMVAQVIRASECWTRRVG